MFFECTMESKITTFEEIMLRSVNDSSESPREHWLRRALCQVADRFSVATRLSSSKSCCGVSEHKEFTLGDRRIFVACCEELQLF